jgi:hypothetical protein
MQYLTCTQASGMFEIPGYKIRRYVSYGFLKPVSRKTRTMVFNEVELRYLYIFKKLEEHFTIQKIRMEYVNKIRGMIKPDIEFMNNNNILILDNNILVFSGDMVCDEGFNYIKIEIPTDFGQKVEENMGYNRRRTEKQKIEMIMNCVPKTSFISTSQISNRLPMCQETIRRQLGKLQEENIVELKVEKTILYWRKL